RRRAGRRLAAGRSRPVQVLRNHPGAPARVRPGPAAGVRRSRGRGRRPERCAHRTGAGGRGPSSADSSVRGPGPWNAARGLRIWPSVPRPRPSARGGGERDARARRTKGKTRLEAGLSCIAMWQPRKDSNLRMPESESGALPLGDGAMGPIVTPPHDGGVDAALTLGELGGAAGLVQADLLALDLARVAGHEPGPAQLGLERLVVLD